MTKEGEIRVVGISGPTGAGKDYLSIHTREVLGLGHATMLTTRPARPAGSENKIPVSLDEFRGYKDHELIGKHEDAGIHYAYRIEDLKNIGQGLLELNPVLQAHVPIEAKKYNIKMMGWIGLWGEEEYLIGNIGRRQNMGPEELEKRLELSRGIMDRLRHLHRKGVVTHLYKVGWENRETMADEFAEMVRDILGR